MGDIESWISLRNENRSITILLNHTKYVTFPNFLGQKLLVRGGAKTSRGGRVSPSLRLLPPPTLFQMGEEKINSGMDLINSQLFEDSC